MASRTRTSMCCAPSGPSCRTADGAASSAGNMCWTNTASASGDGAGNYVFNAVPTTDWGQPRHLGAVGGRQWAGVVQRQICGEMFWIAASTIAAYEHQGVDQLPHRPRRPPPSRRWSRRASIPTKATSTAGSGKPMPCCGRQKRKIASLLGWLKEVKAELSTPSRLR